ncbi:hypothetical protein [Leifsonia sp. P73]|uniref:hypothetical protein n=1 Tax=Leifsonia sp. P73 TaxID=3423959 RepID=UPI003DA5652C
MFGDTVGWRGGTLYNEKLHKQERPENPMSLTLKTDGTGIAENIPQGVQATEDKACITVTHEERYRGAVKWQRHSDFSFEIEFADSKYRVLSGKGKFAPDWTEARIYTCNYGLEYWRMPISCARPDFVAVETWTCD